MIQRFEFDPRPDCVCGGALPRHAAKVECWLPQGTVTFCRCPACGSYIQSPRLTSSSLAAWYESAAYRGDAETRGVGYLDYGSGEARRRAEARLRFRRDLAPYLPPAARLLEIGAASGALLAEARERGHAALGCDLSAIFTEAARRHYGLDVATGDWLDLAVPDVSLDAIIMLGTASNLASLGTSLDKMHRTLKPGGFLFFNFPAADSWPAKLYGRRMWMFTPSVMQFMTRRGAALALEAAGLQLERQETDRQSPTLSKLIGHTRLGFAYAAVARLGLAQAALPFGVPLPGIVAARARRVS